MPPPPRPTTHTLPSAPEAQGGYHMFLEAGLVGMHLLGPLTATLGNLRFSCVLSSKFPLWPFCERPL